MDLNSLIVIVIAVAAIILFIKLVVSPLLRAVAGIIIFVIAIYILQRYFGLDLNNILKPLGLSWINNFLQNLNLYK